MKITIVILSLLGLALAYPSAIETNDVSTEGPVVTDIKEYMDVLLQQLKDKLDEDKALKLPDYERIIIRRIGFIPIKTKVEVKNAVIKGLHSLESYNNTMKTEGDKVTINAHLKSDHISISANSRIGVKKPFIDDYFMKKLDVELIIESLDIEMTTVNDMSVMDSKPKLVNFRIKKDLDIKFKFDTHLGPASWIGNFVANKVAERLIKKYDLKKRLPELIKPQLEKVLQSIDSPF